MPIEIKELHIRIAVNTEGAAPAPGAAPAAPGGNAPNRDELLAQCLEQVMQVVHASKER